MIINTYVGLKNCDPLSSILCVLGVLCGSVHHICLALYIVQKLNILNVLNITNGTTMTSLERPALVNRLMRLGVVLPPDPGAPNFIR